MDLTYLEMQQKVHQMKMVNDFAECVIAVAKECNCSLTKDKKQN